MPKQTKKRSAYLIAMVLDDPLPGIRNVRNTMLALNKMSYEASAAACIFTRMLVRNKALRSDFYAEPFFYDVVRHHPTKDLLHVIQYLNEAERGNESKVASAHSIALQSLCDDDDVADEDLLDRIMAGGYKGLVFNDDSSIVQYRDDDALAPAKTRQTVKTKPLKALSDDDDLLVNDGDEEAEDGTNSDLSQNRKPVKRSKPPMKPVPWNYMRKCVSVRPSSSTDLPKIIQALADGKSVTTTITAGRYMDSRELYKGGGNFLEVIMDKYTINEK